MNRFLLAFILLATTQVTQAAKLEDYLDRKEIQRKLREEIADQDISFGVDLGNIDLIEGINLSSRYRYDVEASYIDKFYTRIDKWDINTQINIGEVFKNAVDLPFSFSVNRNNSFFFVRQFPKKTEAMKALPYTPLKLPLNAKMALKNLSAGDFVSMPANLNVAVEAQASTSNIAPIVVNANAGVYFVISGEFIIQVFKIDNTHVRLKLIAQRGKSTGARASVGASFNIFGVRVIDKQIERLLDRDLAQYGYSYSPGSQFTIDYVFDLANKDAQMAYDQILSSTLKFRDLILNDLRDGKDLKDKLISSYEKADELFKADINIPGKFRRVHRIFKGFNNRHGHTKHIKMALLVTGYTKDKTFTENKITFINKKEENLEFFYPTYSKYIETKTGTWIFELKDQSFQNNFGLIPKFGIEDVKTKNPDLGLTFERKDRYFTEYEQKAILKFLYTQMPTSFSKDIDLSQWKTKETKVDSRIFFQLILKSQGFSYLKNIPPETMRKKLFEYIKEKKTTNIDNDGPDDPMSLPKLEKLKDFLNISRFIKKEQVERLASSLSTILKDKNKNSEEMTKELVALNETGIFDRIGLGFLISLLPQEKIADLAYMKLNIIGKELNPVNVEVGTLNYEALYKELTLIQSRLSNRGYDLRISEEDREMEDTEISVPAE